MNYKFPVEIYDFLFSDTLMVKGKNDEVWDHFIPLDEAGKPIGVKDKPTLAKCKYCEFQQRANGTRMAQHLKKKHTEVPQGLQATQLEAVFFWVLDEIEDVIRLWSFPILERFVPCHQCVPIGSAHGRSPCLTNGLKGNFVVSARVDRKTTGISNDVHLPPQKNCVCHFYRNPGTKNGDLSPVTKLLSSGCFLPPIGKVMEGVG